jgi:hypothetical protein
MNEWLARAVGRLVFSALVVGAVAAFVALAQRTACLRDELVDAGCAETGEEVTP